MEREESKRNYEEKKEKMRARARDIEREANEKKEELRMALEGFEGSWREDGDGAEG